MRLIDADALMKRAQWFEEYLEGQEVAFKYIDPDDIEDAPTIDAEEVVHGRWDDSGRYQFPNGRKAIRCNMCGCALHENEYHLLNWNYCPVCGAKMDGERKTE